MFKLSFRNVALLLIFFLVLSTLLFIPLRNKPISQDASSFFKFRAKECNSRVKSTRNNNNKNHTISTFIPSENKRKYGHSRTTRIQHNNYDKSISDMQNSKYKNTRTNKIAILLTGSIRTFGQVFYFLQNEFFGLNDWPDLFISMVYREESEKLSYDAISSMLKNVVVERVEKANVDQLKEKAKKVYSHFPFTGRECTHLFTIEKCTNWVYSISLIRDSFEDMKKHNDIMKEKLQLNRDYYDIVVRLRSDVFFENRVDLLNFKVDENTLYTPLIYNWGGVNDQVSFGSVKVMDSMSQLFFEIEKIKDDTKAMFHPETFLHKLIVQRQHKIENVPISYRLIRNLQFESPSDDVREPFDEYDYS